MRKYFFSFFSAQHFIYSLLIILYHTFFFPPKAPKILFQESAKDNCSPSLPFKHFQYSLEPQDTRDDIHLIKPLYFRHLNSSLWASFLHVAECGEPREAVGVPSKVFKARMDWALGRLGRWELPLSTALADRSPCFVPSEWPQHIWKRACMRKCPSLHGSWWWREGIVPSAPAQCPKGADVQQVLIPGDHGSSTEPC